MGITRKESLTPGVNQLPLVAVESTNNVERTDKVIVEPTPKTRTNDDPQYKKQILDKINILTQEILSLKNVKLSGLITDGQNKDLSKKEKEIAKLQKKLAALKQDAIRHKTLRASKKRKIQELVSKYPDIKDELKQLDTRSSAGRPRLEESQPQLLKTIIDIVLRGSIADDRRRKENLRSCMTLEDLHLELLRHDFQISRAGVYLRLLPRNKTTCEGRKHVVTVPVKLLRAPNTERKKHQDSHFAMATIEFIKNLIELLGPKAVFVCSQDDKAKVPLGIPAATLQSPILMHMDYKVTLPDHDFVIASRHKLIPSVYAGLSFDANGKLGYSGPTYIAIRSMKHDKSTAKSHSHDLGRLLCLESFAPFCEVKEDYKPIFVLFIDGGPDENPRFPSVLLECISNFKKYKLDALFVATQAPGYSAYNPVERRMAPLSRDLCGLVLPHDEYGTHLTRKGETMELDLEKKNFSKILTKYVYVHFNENFQMWEK